MPRRVGFLLRYGLAVLTVLGAVLLRWLLQAQLGHTLPFITFFPAVAVVARYAGLGPTLLAICLSALAVDATILPPGASLAPEDAEESLAQILFISLSLIIAWLGQSQRRAIHAVAAEKDRLRVVMESIGDAVVATDALGLITFLNPMAARLTGWDAREAVGRTLAEVVDLVCPDSGIPLSDRLSHEACTQRGQPSPTPATLRTRAGAQREVEQAIAPIQHESGQCHGLVLVFRDISNRRRSERALAESEARFRQLADAMPQMVWIARADGYLESYNRRWYDYTGLTEEDSTGHGWRTPLHPDDRPHAEDLWHRAVNSGEPYEIQYRIRGADGRYRWFLGRALPVHDVAGRITQWFGTCTDIDGQKRAEEALVDNRQRLRAALVASNTGTFRWNLASDEVDFDESLDHLFGLGPNESVSRLEHFTRAIHPDDLPGVLAQFDRCRHGEGDFDMEFRILLPNGHVRWLLDRGKLLYDHRGYPTTMIGACVDISHHKEVETELIAAKEQAEAASRAKDQFLAMLSHELRAPLTPVLLTATAMLDDPSTTADLRPFLDLVRQNIALEARLIDDLLDVTRIIRNKLSFHFNCINIHDIIRGTIDICRGEVEEKGVSLVTELKATATHLRGDSSRLQQVFWNLIKNAAKFTPAGGTITIRTRNDHASATRVLIEVADTGIGIDHDALPRIFNAFEQAEDAITRQYGGLGLGLAISRSIIEAHGGTLSAWSAGRGQGATFTIALETVAAPVATSPDPEPAPNDRTEADRPVRLLLVEDDPLASRVMAQLLRRVGHQVTTATTVKGALAVSPDDYDLVVSDIGLPDGSGHDVMRQIRLHHDIPGIALTGYGSEDDARLARESGFVAHLVKPIDFARLDTVIRQVAEARATTAS